MKRTPREPAAPKPEDLADLEAKVAKMRALGVTEWGDIKLGPAPAAAPAERAEPTKEELRERAERKETRRRDVLFAASRIRPYVTPKERA